MNAPNPTPSPLVPQGSIPPKNTSRSGRVLIIALTVVAFHIAGLGVVLMQGCQKDAQTAGGSSLETNGLSLPPMDTNASMFASASTNGTVTTNPPNPLAGMGATPTGVVAYTPPTAMSNPPAVGFTEPPTSLPMAETPSVPMTDYKVVRGDTLGGIARKHKISLGALTKVNPDLDPAKLQVGKMIKVPAAPASAAPATVTATMGGNSVGNGAAVTASTYKVKAGDNLTKIARAHGITVKQLTSANNIKTSQIKVGQTLKIPARTTADSAATTQH